MRRVAALGALVLALAAGGCGNSAERAPSSTLTEAQRDSVLGKSALPGSGTIGRAQEAAAGEATPGVSVDSLTR